MVIGPIGLRPALMLGQHNHTVMDHICGVVVFVLASWFDPWSGRGRCDRDHMVVGYTTLSTIYTYHHLRCEFESCSWQDVLDTTLCDKVCH